VRFAKKPVFIAAFLNQVKVTSLALDKYTRGTTFVNDLVTVSAMVDAPLETR
jgi:hypothetical protein